MSELTLSDRQLDCAVDLMLRLPTQQVGRNLGQVAQLAPHLREEVVTGTDQPLGIATDPDAGRQYLLCEYNRAESGHSFRSPWTNAYYPQSGEDEVFPLPYLRTMEVCANEAFIEYSRLYYDGCLSSVYFRELHPSGFAAAILLKNSVSGLSSVEGGWDSLHAVEVHHQHGLKRATYKMTSSVMLWLKTTRQESGLMNLGGVVHRQVQRDLKVSNKERNKSHLVNIGELVEQAENRLRNSMKEIYFWKTEYIVDRCLRSVIPLDHRVKPKRRFSLPRAGSISIRRSPSGKHLLIPALQDLKV